MSVDKLHPAQTATRQPAPIVIAPRSERRRSRRRLRSPTRHHARACGNCGCCSWSRHSRCARLDLDAVRRADIDRLRPSEVQKHRAVQQERPSPTCTTSTASRSVRWRRRHACDRSLDADLPEHAQRDRRRRGSSLLEGVGHQRARPRPRRPLRPHWRQDAGRLDDPEEFIKNVRQGGRPHDRGEAGRGRDGLPAVAPLDAHAQSSPST